MKIKTIIAALALFALVGCFGKKEDKTDAIIEANENGTADVAELLVAAGADADARNDDDKLDA
ncbi:MAG: hypothetical protein K2I95_03300, partial [Treponemataceae bacterium]|nr:hypothetical protein [Treponemataceae bacterium]